MKCLILCASLLQVAMVIAAATTAEVAAQRQQRMAECLKKHEVTEADFTEMANNKSRKLEDVQENIKCALHCYLSTGGYMDDAGKFDAVKAKNDVLDIPQQEIIQKSIEKCKDVTAANKCDAAYLVLECLDGN